MRSTARQRWKIPALTLALASACESASAPAPEKGEIRGIWAERAWVGDASAILLERATAGSVLYVFGSRPRGAPFAGESLRARVVLSGLGDYALGPDDVEFLELVGGDAVIASYRGVGQPSGLLRITRYEGPGGIVEGELRFAAETQYPASASYGKTARFESGRFRAIVSVSPLGASP